MEGWIFLFGIVIRLEIGEKFRSGLVMCFF